MEVQATEIIDNRLTVNQAASAAGVTRVTINRWMASGKLRFTKTPTGRVRIEPDDLRAVLGLK